MADGFVEQEFSLKGKNIFIAGHNGMVGAALVRRLEIEECDIVTAPRSVDLREQAGVRRWMQAHKPDIVVLAAAKVGGIAANMATPADFLYDNLMIEANVIHAAHEAGVEKLLFLGSSCIYPKDAAQPIKEEALLTGALEETNAAYAVAKIAGVQLCQAYRAQYGRDFISAMPCNLYGPGDTFDAEHSHVIPALIMKTHAAAREGAEALEVWGSGKPRREFLHVDDCADALVFLLKNYSGAKPVNVGAGEDISIAELAQVIADAAGYRGRLAFNTHRPDGVSAKLMDSSRLYHAGWKPRMALKQGIAEVFAWYREQQEKRRAA
jgi:GDP-L-fucose synthase